MLVEAIKEYKNLCDTCCYHPSNCHADVVIYGIDANILVANTAEADKVLQCDGYKSMDDRPVVTRSTVCNYAAKHGVSCVAARKELDRQLLVYDIKKATTVEELKTCMLEMIGVDHG